MSLRNPVAEHLAGTIGSIRGQEDSPWTLRQCLGLALLREWPEQTLAGILG